MLKKLSLFLLSVLLWVPGYSQDKIRSIKLTVNAPNPEIIDCDHCQLSVLATDYGNSSTVITVNVENIFDGPIFLFGIAYPEKMLKKERIQFDKKSYGSHSRNVKICEGVPTGEILMIKPGANRLLTIDNVDEPMKQLSIPVYYAKVKKKKPFGKEKYMIQGYAQIILNMTLIADAKTDNEYEEIKSTYDDLIAMIEQKRVCPHPNHAVSKQEQIQDIKDRINDLKDEISDIKSEHHWRERDEAYKPYKELLENLDNIEIKEEVCSKCQRINPTSRKHNCAFCSKSPADILSEIEGIYKQLDNRRIRKSDAKKNVETMRKAWNGGCPNLTKKMTDDTVNKDKVEIYYNSIVTY